MAGLHRRECEGCKLCACNGIELHKRVDAHLEKAGRYRMCARKTDRPSFAAGPAPSRGLQGRSRLHTQHTTRMLDLHAAQTSIRFSRN